MSKHHRNEPLVKQLLCAKGKDKKLLLTDLRNKGNNQHNEDVLKAKKGELLLSRRCNEKKFSVSNYGPCPNCLSWILLANIHRHKCTTSKKSASVHVSKGNLLIQSAVLAGRVTGEADQTLVREVFPIMKDYKVGVLARQDRLIVGLGNQWMRRNVGNKLMRKYYASAVMRLASRLLIQLNSMVTPASGKDLESYIHPMYFTEIAKATLKVARQDEDDEEKIEAPSNAIKLAYDLKRMGNLKLANAIKQCDNIKKSEAKDFLKLMQLEWTTKLSRVALEERKHLKNKPLPLPEDVQKLAVYLRSEMENFNIEDTSYENFRNGVILAEAGLITYNRRRPGEIQALSLMAYENRKTCIDEVSEEIAHNLSSFEKKLVESQDVIENRGKCGKYVPVIVPSHIRRILKYLADPGIRRNVGIPSKPYIFATNKLLENSRDLGEIGGDAEKASLDQTEDSREDGDFIPDLLEQIEEPTKSKPDKRKAPTLNRHKWIFKELEELKDVFKEFFRKDKTPGKKHIEDGKKRRINLALGHI
ncbi:uncharacterized protein LOC132545279 [Ylistrum balloti]|uniref:uncharacterized protein LOC132545279 n=1 Tax=Ylistrum balloti TaxID=509963 RepID=UPI002905EC4C|nr:uncharacterized protein LOC132545279 [Ylistrum balloti]